MSEGRTTNSLKNVIWNYINLVVGLLLGFINRAIFIKAFGVGYLGISGLFANIISILSLADMGLSTAMAYSYYKPISNNDYDKIAALNNFYRKAYNIIAIVVTVVGISLIPFLKFIVKLDEPIENMNLYYVLTLAGTVSTYLVVHKSTLINAYQKNYIVSKYNSIVKILVAVAQIIFMLLTKNYIVYLVIVVIGNLANNIRVSIAADKLFPFIKNKKSLCKDEQKDILKNVKSMFVYKLSAVFINSTDNILISLLVGTIWVGYYYNYSMIITQVISFITLTFTSLTASIGNLVVCESEEKRHELFKATQIASFWFSTVIVASIYAVINDFIVVWLGQECLLDSLTLFAIMFNLYLTCVLQPIWIYREATGIFTKTKYMMMLTAVLNIALSIIGGIYLGLAGILLASAVAKILTYVWYEPILLYKEYFKKGAKGYFLTTLLNLIITAFLTFGLLWLISIIHLTGWLGFFVKGIIAFILANVIYLIVYSRSKGFKMILTKIKTTLKKGK